MRTIDYISRRLQTTLADFMWSVWAALELQPSLGNHLRNIQSHILKNIFAKYLYYNP